MSLGMTYSPQSLGEGLQVTNLQPNIIMVIGKCTVVFRGFFFGFGCGVEGRGYVGGSFLGETCHGGTEIQ